MKILLNNNHMLIQMKEKTKYKIKLIKKIQVEADLKLQIKEWHHKCNTNTSFMTY